MEDKEYLEYLNSGIYDNSLQIAVVGLGYVGLPTALAFHSKGFKVLGIDTSENVISSLNSGLSHLSDEFNPDIPSDENWQISNFYDNIKECDIIIICVPTPVNSSFEPDLSMVHNAFEEISKNTSETEDLTLILESTVQPGTTNNCFSMFFDNIDDTKNFNIAYCPERISPGDSFYGGHNVDRIIGSNNITLTKVLTKLYQKVNNGEIHSVKSVEVAEAAKLVENTQRDIDIAFVNELATLMPKLGLDVEDVLDAASTKWNFHRHTPGIGVGGHCIPIDPHYYMEIAKRYQIKSALSPHARNLNKSMPEYASRDILEICKGIDSPKILILGYSYKPNVGDYRETPVIPLINNLIDKDTKILVWDPYVDSIVEENQFIWVNDIYSLEGLDCLVIATGHNCIIEIDWNRLKNSMNRAKIYDGRRCLDPDEITRLGWEYYALGRPGVT